MIKAIIFDYGNVIEKLDNSIFTKKISLYSSFSDKKIYDLIFHNSDIQKKYETGLIGSNDFFLSVSTLCRLEMDIEPFRKAYTEIFTPERDIIEMIKFLRGKYKLGLISNTSEWDFQYAIKKNEVFDLFDTISLSFQVKAMKPDKKIFFDSLNKLDLSAKECVYIDDIKTYSDRAIELGMVGIQYKNFFELKKEFRNLNIL